MGIVWENPPERRHGRGKDTRTEDEKFADQLRKNPGRWARYRKDANSSLAYQIKTGARKAFQPAGAFDAVCRAMNDDNKSRGAIYIRYIGREAGNED